MPLAEMSVAYTPPPLPLKPDPYVAVLPEVTPQPALSPLAERQVEVERVPVMSLEEMSQVTPVCSVAWFV